MKCNELFVGREKELEYLLEGFENVKNGNPTISVLMGETGLGKTRLIQQFYQSIATEMNESASSKYWPDMLQAGKSLSLNPEFYNTRNMQNNMPWFWWAMRGIQPSQRNASEETSCVLIKSLHHLTPHVKLMQEKSNEHEEEWSFAENSIKVIAALVDLFTTGGVITTGVGIYGTIQDSKAVVDTAKSINNKSSFNHISEYKDNEQKEFTEIVQDFFEKIILNDLNVPLILVVDDAQWIDSDSVMFLEKLYRVALENNLPLYIIATHWSAEWYSNKNKESTFSNLCHKNKIDPYIIKPITDHSDVNKILNACLPGLTNLQKEKIIHKTSGNFGYLYDLIFYFCADENKDLFVEDNNTKQLNKYGEEELENIITELDHVALIQKRFNHYDEPIRKILMWSSFQGEEFFELLTKEVGNRIDNFIDVPEEISKAKIQYNAIESTLENISAFPNRALFEVAFKKLKSRKFDIFTDHFLTIMNDWFDHKKYEQYPVSVETFLLLFKSLTEKEDDKYSLILVELLLNYMNTRQFAKLDLLTMELVNLDTTSYLNKKILKATAETLEWNSYFESTIALSDLLISQIDTKSTDIEELHNISQYLYIKASAQFHRGVGNDLEDVQFNVTKAINLIKDFVFDAAIDLELYYYIDLSDYYDLLGTIYLNVHCEASIVNYEKSISLLQNNINRSEERYRVTLDIQLANRFGNVGLAYEKQENYNEALTFYKMQTSIFNNLNLDLLNVGDLYILQNFMANAELNIGVIFLKATTMDKDKYLAYLNFTSCIDRLNALKDELGNMFAQTMTLNLMKAYTYRGQYLLLEGDYSEAKENIEIAIKVGENISNFSMFVINEILANAYFLMIEVRLSLGEDTSLLIELDKGLDLLNKMKSDSFGMFNPRLHYLINSFFKIKTRMESIKIENEHSSNSEKIIQELIVLKNKFPSYDIVFVDTFLGKANVDSAAHCNTMITKEIETQNTIEPILYDSLITDVDKYADNGLAILLNIVDKIQENIDSGIKDIFYTSLARAYKFKGIARYMSQDGNKVEAVKYFNMSIESYDYVEDKDKNFYFYLENVKQLREDCLRLT